MLNRIKTFCSAAFWSNTFLFLKARLPLFKKLCLFASINASSFTLKAIYILKIFKFFLLTFLIMQENGLIEKVSFKIYNVFYREQIIPEYIFPNIPSSIINKRKKFGQLLKYIFTNIFSSKIIKRMTSLFLEITLNEVKARVQVLSFKIFL